MKERNGERVGWKENRQTLRGLGRVINDKRTWKGIKPGYEIHKKIFQRKVERKEEFVVSFEVAVLLVFGVPYGICCAVILVKDAIDKAPGRDIKAVKKGPDRHQSPSLQTKYVGKHTRRRKRVHFK